MRLLVVLTVVEIVALVAVLAYFLNRVARQLNAISANLARVAWGVRAVETQCAVIGPTVDQVNGNLQQVADGLGAAVPLAKRLAG